MLPMDTMMLGLRLAHFSPPEITAAAPTPPEPLPRRPKRRVRKCCLWCGRIFRRIFWFNVFVGMLWMLAHLSEYIEYTYDNGAGVARGVTVEEHTVNVVLWWVVLILLPVLFVYFTTNRRRWV